MNTCIISFSLKWQIVAQLELRSKFPHSGGEICASAVKIFNLYFQ